MRLIDADALLYNLEIVPLTDDGGVDANDLDDIIKRQPTIEPKHADDLISRQDAIETIRNTLADGMLSSTLELRINDLPSAQYEPEPGRWIKDRRASLNGGSYEVFVCSECESAFNWRMRYCGHCGAKMEVERE